jgi:hypothetical protein
MNGQAYKTSKTIRKYAIAVKKRVKRGTTKTTRNDYFGMGNGTWMEMDKGRGGKGFSAAMRQKIAQMFESVKGAFRL